MRVDIGHYPHTHGSIVWNHRTLGGWYDLLRFSWRHRQHIIQALVRR